MHNVLIDINDLKVIITMGELNQVAAFD